MTSKVYTKRQELVKSKVILYNVFRPNNTREKREKNVLFYYLNNDNNTPNNYIFVAYYHFLFFSIYIFQKCLGFTGVDQVYEKPDAPELVLKTIHLSVEESTMQVVQMLEENVNNFISVGVYLYK